METFADYILSEKDWIKKNGNNALFTAKNRNIF